MPKTNHPLTVAKTSPGVSYTIPNAKLIDSVMLDDAYTYLVALDTLEEALLDAAAREVIEATVPGYRGEYVLPVIEWRGRTVLRVHGQFPPVLKGPDGKPRKIVRGGATVTMRAMLKCWPAAKGLTVMAYPSRIDVHGKDPISVSAKRATKPADPAQLDMDLAPPADPVAEPAPIIRKPRATKPKPAPKKPTTKTRAVVMPHGMTRAMYARERAVIARTRMQARAAMEDQDPKPVRKSRKKAAPLPENVIVFPVHRTRKPSR